MSHSYQLKYLIHPQQPLLFLLPHSPYLSEEWNLNGAASDAIDAGEAEILWAMEIPESLSAPPDLSIPGQVLLYRGDEQLISYSSNGEILWGVPTPNYFADTAANQTNMLTIPAVSQGALYLIGSEGIRAVNFSGEVLWEEDLAGAPQPGSAIYFSTCCKIDSEGRFYWHSSSSVIQVFDPFEGLIWERQIQDDFNILLSNIFVAPNGDVVYYFKTNQYTYFLSYLSRDGEIIWTVEITDTIQEYVERHDGEYIFNITFTEIIRGI